MQPVAKKFFVLFGISVMLLGLGFGCKGVSKEEQALIQPVELNYWTVFGDTQELRSLAQQFQQIRPHVRVNIRKVRYDEFDSLFVNALADDVGPDIVSMHTRWLRKYLNKLDPMPPAVTASRMYVKGTYFKETIVETNQIPMPTARGVETAYVAAVADDAVLGKNIYGLPLSLDTLAIYYNKDLLDSAGIPEPPSTWDEFLNAVQNTTKFAPDGSITQAGTALGTGENVNHAADILALLMMQNGVPVAQNSVATFHLPTGDGSVNVDTLDALRFYTDFANPTREGYTWNADMGRALDEFARGKVVFYFGYAFDLPQILAQAPQMNLEVIPIPQLDNTAPVNVANYWVESVTKKSAHKNEAWDFIRFITSPEGVGAYTQATRQPTPLRGQIATQQEDPLLAPFAGTVLQARNWYQGKDIDTAAKAFTALITDYAKPVPANVNANERNAQLLQKAAQQIQQTM